MEIEWLRAGVKYTGVMGGIYLLMDVDVNKGSVIILTPQGTIHKEDLDIVIEALNRYFKNGKSWNYR